LYSKKRKNFATLSRSICNLGNISIDGITVDPPYIAPLRGYELPIEDLALGAEKRKFNPGIILDPGAGFSSSAAIGFNTTHLLGSVAYDLNHAASNARRVDIIVAFRVVNFDSEAAVTWKRLLIQPAPILIFK